MLPSGGNGKMQNRKILQSKALSVVGLHKETRQGCSLPNLPVTRHSLKHLCLFIPVRQSTNLPQKVQLCESVSGI